MIAITKKHAVTGKNYQFIKETIVTYMAN